MFSLILHTHPSAYNPEGHCVAYANTKERDENREARLKKYGNYNCCTLYCCCCFGKSNSEIVECIMNYLFDEDLQKTFKINTQEKESTKIYTHTRKNF